MFHFCSLSVDVVKAHTRSYLYYIQLGLIVSGLIDTNVNGVYVLDFVFNFNLLALFPYSPIALTPIQELLARFIYPLIFFVCLFILAIVEIPVFLYRRRDNEVSYPFHHYSRTFLNFLMFSFNSLTYALWSAAKCTNYTQNGTTHSLNALIPAVDCNTTYGKQAVNGALYGALPLLCIEIIIVFAFLQYSDQKSRMGGETLARYCGAWYRVYEKRRHHYEVAIFIRRFIIILFIVYLSNSVIMGGYEFIAVAVFEFVNLIIDAVAGPYDQDSDEGPNANYVHIVVHAILVAMAVYRFVVQSSYPYSNDTNSPNLVLAVLLWAPTLVYVIWRSRVAFKQVKKYSGDGWILGANASGAYEAEEYDD